MSVSLSDHFVVRLIYHPKLYLSVSAKRGRSANEVSGLTIVRRSVSAKRGLPAAPR